MTPIYEIIKKVCEKRREEKTFPHSVSFIELKGKTSLEEDELRRQLNGLFIEKKIRVYKTLNDIGIELFDKERHEKEKKD